MSTKRVFSPPHDTQTPLINWFVANLAVFGVLVAAVIAVLNVVAHEAHGDALLASGTLPLPVRA